MHRVFLLFLAAQPGPIDPPLVDRPVDFSNVVGEYMVKVNAAPTDVQVEEPITLRIEITGAGPEKYEPSRKHLHPLFLDTWKDDFYVHEIRGEQRAWREKNTWVFVYRLKPRRAGIDAIGDFKLVYYNPARRKFLTAYSGQVKITVRKKSDEPEPFVIEPIAAPESLYAVTTSPDILAHGEPSLRLTGLPFVLVVGLPPLACFFAVMLWRRFFPDEIRRAREHRHGAARRALRALEADGGNAWDIVCRYLQERLDFPVEDPTPAEVFGFLKRRGFTIAVCDQGRAFFDACDSLRYTTNASADVKELAVDAGRLIHALEADPCARA
jgi:hypothetical protein